MEHINQQQSFISCDSVIVEEKKKKKQRERERTGNERVRKCVRETKNVKEEKRNEIEPDRHWFSSPKIELYHPLKQRGMCHLWDTSPKKQRDLCVL